MKRLAAVIGLVILGIGLNASAEGQTISFSGKWILNNEKSDSVPRVTPIGRAAGPDTPIGRPPVHTPNAKTPVGSPPNAKTPVGTPPNAKTPVGTPPATRAAGPVPEALRGSGFGYGIGGGTFDGTTPVANDVPLIITQTETEMRIVNALRVNDTNVPNEENYKLDGKKYEEVIHVDPSTEGRREIQASLKKNKIKIEVVTTNSQGRQFRTTREFSLSKDGKTLTVEASAQSPNLLSKQKMVYDKN